MVASSLVSVRWASGRIGLEMLAPPKVGNPDEVDILGCIKK